MYKGVHDPTHCFGMLYAFKNAYRYIACAAPLLMSAITTPTYINIYSN